MMDSEKLDIILSEVRGTKSEIQNMNAEIQEIKADIQELKLRTTAIELHIENSIEKSIQLIAENFIDLTRKLNQAIPAADKNLAYEVKVNLLSGEVDRLKAKVAELMATTA
ncbi:MAG: hypothetical protein NC092_11100 [Butyrivibrio sp.]|nr:hypothetical protein [Muribaculum sp.]MCM1553227.1 hypothetical protein [Butyrivibrio sp.]